MESPRFTPSKDPTSSYIRLVEGYHLRHSLGRFTVSVVPDRNRDWENLVRVQRDIFWSTIIDWTKSTKNINGVALFTNRLSSVRTVRRSRIVSEAVWLGDDETPSHSVLNPDGDGKRTTCGYRPGRRGNPSLVLLFAQKTQRGKEFGVCVSPPWTMSGTRSLVGGVWRGL